jgi:hypothetical protein
VFGTRRVRRTRTGQYDLRLPDPERELLGTLVSQLRHLVTDPDRAAHDPTLRRLFPTAYPQDEEREAEYRQMVGDELREARLQALDTMERTLAAMRVDESELVAWMGAINDVRLVLGTRLDVSEETSFDVDPANPEAPLLAAYAYLGYLLEEIVDALSKGL